MDYDSTAKRQALEAFLKANGLSARGLGAEAGLSSSAISQFMNGRVESLSERTYDRLAAAATRLLGRNVTAAELRGEVAPTRKTVVAGYIGAGGTIVFEDGYAKGAGMEEVEMPPGETKEVVAVAIRGTSQLPLYREGEVVYYSREPPYTPLDLLNTACVVRLAEPDGRIMLKTIKKGSKPRTFTLTSTNDVDIPNVKIDWVAPVMWVKRTPPARRSTPPTGRRRNGG